MQDLLHDIGVSVIAATVLGLLAHWLKQPIILAYIIAGVVVGPTLGFGFVSGDDNIHTISEIGLVLLLFVIGLEMDLRQLAKAGRKLLLPGIGQFPVCVALGVGLFSALGYGLTGSHSDGLYLALVCALSSTAIVVKLLYDKVELDTTPGRLTLGVLVIQDVYAILVLAFQPSFAHPSAWPIVKALAASAALLAAGFVTSKFVLRPVFVSIARAPEMVVAVSIGWCALVAGAAAAMGLSKEMGALIAGLSIAAFPYSLHVTAKTLPLRDFFLTLFFVTLGMTIPVPDRQQAGMIALVVGFVLVSRFLSVYPLLSLAGAGRRTAFIASVNLAQISEFGLVIAGLGLVHEHISMSTHTIIGYAMAITAVLGSYAIRYNHQLYKRFDRALLRAGLRDTRRHERDDDSCDEHPIAVLGFHRGARAFIDHLRARNPDLVGKTLVVDFNLESLKELKQEGVAGTFGDISSHDTLLHAHLDRARMILLTIPDMLLKGIDNRALVKSCRAIASHAIIVATAENAEQERLLEEAGASLVLKPYDLMGDHLAAYVDYNLQEGALSA